MTLDNYDYETIRADELNPGDFIWLVGRPCRILDVTVNGKTTSFTAITGIGMYSTTAFVRSSEALQIRILNSGVLF